MIDAIEFPCATARVVWLGPNEGGRASGPPSGPTYAANCAFPLGGEPETVPGWPASAEKFSVVLERITVEESGAWLCKVDFFARHLVVGYLRPSAAMLIMEGPKVVGEAEILEVLITEAD